MNFKITNELIDAIKPYTENASITIFSDNKEGKGQSYASDVVMIDEENDVGFEVFDNEIIVFYFTDHYHFEDYSSDVKDGDDDYIKRAKEFILKLFENKIKYVQIYRGKKLAAEKYYFLYSDITEERIGGTWWGLEHFLNPLAKKTSITTVYTFDKAKGCFGKEE